MEINTTSLTAQLAEQIVHANPSEEAIHSAQHGVMDYIAVCFAGRDDTGVDKLITLYTNQRDRSCVPIIGRKVTFPPYEAALINGFLGHALDFDDVHSDVRGHPTTVILPALISTVTSYDTFTCKDFLAAYCVGVEVMSRLGNAIGSEHFVRGWHNTSTLGVIAATAAIGYLKRFSANQMAKAIGFAATQSSGLRVQFGTEAKPLHAGLAAQTALRSIDFVEADLGGSLCALDGPLGFFQLYGKGETFAAPFLLEGWSNVWKIVTPGLWFKRYPFCSAAHHAADAAFQLKADYSILTREIEAVRVLFPPNGDAALVHKNPKTGEEGRFSVEYVLSLIFNNYPLSLHSFRQASIPKDIEKFMNKISRVYDDSIIPTSNAIPFGRFTIVEVILKHGVKYQVRVDCPKGSPQNPLSHKELKQKLKECIDEDVIYEKILQNLLDSRLDRQAQNYFDFTMNN